MGADDLWTKLDALPWKGPWIAHTFEIDCPCPNGDDCGDSHSCAEVEAREDYPASPEEPVAEGRGQCIVQISTPGIELFAKPCAEFIAAARNELPGIRAELDAAKAMIADLREELLILVSEFECAVARVEAGPDPLRKWDHPYDLIRSGPILKHFKIEARRVRIHLARTEPKS